MRSLILFAIALIGTALADPCNASLPSAGASFGGPVTHIIDGDGICVGADQGGIEVRLADFNAPELNTPEGKAAKITIADLTLGKWADCQACEGARGQCRSYDRIIATCRIDGHMIGDLMRAAGVGEGGR